MRDDGVETEALRNFGFAEGLIAHLENHDLDAPLGFRCQPALAWRRTPMDERDIVRLWESGMVLTYFDRDSGTFAQCSLENPTDVWARYGAVQGVLAELFIDLYEDGLEIEQLQETADEAGFLHLDRLMREVGALDGRDWESWRQRFPETCAD
jgi:hypothetical protein